MVLTSMLLLVLSRWISFKITCGSNASFTTVHVGRIPPVVESTAILATTFMEQRALVYKSHVQVSNVLIGLAKFM